MQQQDHYKNVQCHMQMYEFYSNDRMGKFHKLVNVDVPDYFKFNMINLNFVVNLLRYDLNDVNSSIDFAKFDLIMNSLILITK